MAIELYEHNKKAYENVERMFETENRVCVIHATGTGKSFISLKWLYENRDKKCLFATPTYPIIDQMQKYIESNGLSMSDFPNLHFEIYSNINEEFSNNRFDCIVLDEFHRCGAKEWGKGLDLLLAKNEDVKVLGVSATPKRYLDENRDMSKELFNGNVASRLSVAQAVARGILPVPKYINAIYSFDEDIERIQNKIDKFKNSEEKTKLQKRLNEAKQMLENAEGLPEIFKKYISNPNGKYIVFCKSKEHMQRMEKEAKEWFKDINPNLTISEVFFDKSKEINKYTIDRFESIRDNTLKLLFSVEMLNEGLHVKDIDGVIMLRPTQSPIIYMQQLGRALSVGNNDQPIVFDIVNNINSHESIYEFREELKQEFEKNSDLYSDEDIEKILESFKIYDDLKEYSELLEAMDIDSTFSWDKYYELARAYYKTHGDLLIPQNFKTKNDVKLGRWISEQRKTYHGKSSIKITEKHIEKLNNIGMIWDVFDERWNRNYELACAYYKAHGDLLIPYGFKTNDGVTEVGPEENGVNLGEWISKKRKSYKGKDKGKITEEQIKKLNKIGMIWDTLDERWNKNYKLASAYYKVHGDLLIPRGFKTNDGVTEVGPEENGVNLGEWITNQRKAYHGNGSVNITEKNIEKLNEIGMIWDALDERWNRNYELASAYYKAHGNLLIPHGFKTNDGVNKVGPEEKGINLGDWITTQRTAYKGSTKGKVTEEQIKKLNEIGMVWNVSEHKFLTRKITPKMKKQLLERFKSFLNHNISENYEFKSKKDVDYLNEEFNNSLNSTKRNK